MAGPLSRIPIGRAAGRLLHQIGWSFVAKVTAAVLQLVVVVALARGLAPIDFAWVASVVVITNIVVAANGFGIMRQIQKRRAVDPTDPLLGPLFDLRLAFSYGSSVVWVLACLAWWLVHDDVRALALLPLALWLAWEQVAAAWNAISIVDGHTEVLLVSYLVRRVPIVAALVAALALDWDVIWAWTLGSAVGGLLGVVIGRGTQEAWALTWVPRRLAGLSRGTLDFGYWWSELGVQIRDFDVTVVTAVSAYAGGIYALPSRLVKPMNLVTMTVSSVLFAKVARRPYLRRDHLLIGALAGSAPVMLVAGTMAIAAPLVPKVVGQEYADVVGTMRILCLASVITGIGILLVTFMQARSDAASREAGYIVLTAGVVQIVASIWATRVGGAEGAAWAASIIQGIGLVVLWARADLMCRREMAAYRATQSAAEPTSV